ncbi:MAG: hypothetical protein J6A47_10395 [Bacilli bacterium]|nr:hypothetical protein [Bacilli bacterium]MBO6286810.1 hypothetical protein [Bacilli bacterium]
MDFDRVFDREIENGFAIEALTLIRRLFFGFGLGLTSAAGYLFPQKPHSQ